MGTISKKPKKTNKPDAEAAAALTLAVASLARLQGFQVTDDLEQAERLYLGTHHTSPPEVELLASTDASGRTTITIVEKGQGNVARRGLPRVKKARRAAKRTKVRKAG